MRTLVSMEPLAVLAMLWRKEYIYARLMALMILVILHFLLEREWNEDVVSFCKKY